MHSYVVESRWLIWNVNSPVTAKNDVYVKYSKTWTVPEDTTPGSYAIDFVEQVQFRRTQITSTETVKINVVD